MYFIILYSKNKLTKNNNIYKILYIIIYNYLFGLSLIFYMVSKKFNKINKRSYILFLRIGNVNIKKKLSNLN